MTPKTWSGQQVILELHQQVTSIEIDGEMDTFTRLARIARRDAFRMAMDIVTRYLPAVEEEAVTGFRYPFADDEDSPTYRAPAHGKGDPDYVHQYVYEVGPPKNAT